MGAPNGDVEVAQAFFRSDNQAVSSTRPSRHDSAYTEVCVVSHLKSTQLRVRPREVVVSQLVTLLLEIDYPCNDDAIPFVSFSVEPPGRQPLVVLILLQFEHNIGMFANQPPCGRSSRL